MGPRGDARYAARMRIPLLGVVIAAFAARCADRSALARQALSSDAREITLTEGLAVEGVGRSGRRAINVDGVQAMIVEGTLGAVKEGNRVPLPRGMEGERAWKSVKADDKGTFPGERAGWVLCTVASEAERVMVLEARGHMMVYMNGEPRMGDPYSTGYVRLPVLMKKGENRLLFASAGRGGMSARLVAPAGDFELIDSDLTLPDFVVGKGGFSQMGVPIMNASNQERVVSLAVELPGIPSRSFQHIGILSLEFHVDKLSRPLL